MRNIIRTSHDARRRSTADGPQDLTRRSSSDALLRRGSISQMGISQESLGSRSCAENTGHLGTLNEGRMTGSVSSSLGKSDHKLLANMRRRKLYDQRSFSRDKSQDDKAEIKTANVIFVVSLIVMFCVGIFILSYLIRGRLIG